MRYERNHSLLDFNGCFTQVSNINLDVAILIAVLHHRTNMPKQALAFGTKIARFCKISQQDLYFIITSIHKQLALLTCADQSVSVTFTTRDIFRRTEIHFDL